MTHNESHRPTRLLLLSALLSVTAVAAVHAESVTIYSAGSLRAVVTALAADAGSAFQIAVTPTFGGSGLLRERIEKGESPDLFLSADLASPRKLQAQGRTTVPVVPFARNRMCVISETAAQVTPDNLIDRLLNKNLRLKTSTPVADPSGDYAWAIIDRIDTLHPGAGSLLREKAQASMNLTATPASASQSPAVALFASHQIDLMITYCSGSAGLLKELPELSSLPVPSALDPHPVYGAALLSTKPEALRVLLYLLSEKGQSIVAQAGLVPIDPSSGEAP